MSPRVGSKLLLPFYADMQHFDDSSPCQAKQGKRALLFFRVPFFLLKRNSKWRVVGGGGGGSEVHLAVNRKEDHA